MERFDKHKKNLGQVGDAIWSYSTHVANLNHKEKIVHQLGWWSVTTQRHINYVAREYNYKVIDNRRINEQAEKHKDELADRYYNIIKKL